MDNIQDIIKKSLAIASQEFEIELEGQGHAGLIKTMEERIRVVEGEVTGEIYMAYYYQFVNNFTPPAKIPFSGRTGKGGTSKYIEALIRFFERKGADNPKSAAFATAYTQKKEGRPTKGSYLFAPNGRRTGFLEYSLDKIEERIYNQLAEDLYQYFLTLQIFKNG